MDASTEPIRFPGFLQNSMPYGPDYGVNEVYEEVENVVVVEEADHSTSARARESRYMSTQLLNIGLSGNIDDFNRWVRQNSVISETTPSGDTVLHVAAGEGQSYLISQIMRYFPECSAQQNDDGDLPLHIAAKIGHIQVVQSLLGYKRGTVSMEQRSLLSVQNCHYSTALHLALDNGYLDVSSFLVSIGEGINYEANDDGKTPLYLAAERGYHMVVADLLRSSEIDGSCDHVIFAALRSRNSDVLKVVLQQYKSTSPLFDTKGRTFLSAASSIGFSDGVTILLDKHVAWLYHSDRDGSFPIHLASKWGHTEIVTKFLSEYPNTSQLVDDNGRTFFHVAVANGCEGIVRYALKVPILHVTVNQKDKEGDTGLHIATNSKLPEIVRILTQAKQVRTDLLDSKRKTAMDIADSRRTYPTPMDQLLTWHALNLVKAPRGSVSIMEGGSDKFPYEKFQGGLAAVTAAAVLLASASFATTFAVPEGVVSSREKNPGNAVFSRKIGFQAFCLFNALSLISSVVGVIVLIFAQSCDRRLFPSTYRIACRALAFSMVCMLLVLITGMPLFWGGALLLIWCIRGIFILGIIVSLGLCMLLILPDAVHDGFIMHFFGVCAFNVQLGYYKYQKRSMEAYLEESSLVKKGA